MNGLLFFGARPMQHKVDNLLAKPQGSWMPNAQPQPPEVGASELAGDIAYSIVAAVAATLLKPNIARGNVELVVDHKDLLRSDLMKPRQRGNRSARVVHKSLWAAQPDWLQALRGVNSYLADP